MLNITKPMTNKEKILLVVGFVILTPLAVLAQAVYLVSIIFI